MIFWKRILVASLVFACAIINIRAHGGYEELGVVMCCPPSGTIAAATGCALAILENKKSPGITSPVAATIGAGLVGAAFTAYVIFKQRDWGDVMDPILFVLSPFIGAAVGHLAGFACTKRFWACFSSFESDAINKIKGDLKKVPVYIMLPSLKGQSVKDVEEFLKAANINIEILHEKPVAQDHRCAGCHVVDQQPKAGSIVDLSNKITVQLQVSEGS